MELLSLIKIYRFYLFAVEFYSRLFIILLFLWFSSRENNIYTVFNETGKAEIHYKIRKSFLPHIHTCNYMY